MSEACAGFNQFGNQCRFFLSQLLPMAIDNRQRMFCSEFCAAALRFDAPQRFSPALLADVVNRINRLPFVQLAHQINEGMAAGAAQAAERKHHG